MRKTLIAVFVVMFFAGNVLSEETKTVQLEPIVVTPWRSDEDFSDVSRNVTVITEEDISLSTAKDLPELIQNKSGIVVSNQLNNPKGVIVDIRGFGGSSPSNVLVLIDGRRTNQVDLSGVDWGQIDLNAIERIEIIKGPSTTLYGDNASAGTINIITKKGYTKKPQILLSGELGSYKYRKGYANLSGLHALNENSADKPTYVDYFLSFSNQDTTGYRANNDYWSSDYFARSTIYSLDKFEIGLSGGYHRDHYGMPGALYLTDIENIGRRGTTHPDDKGFTSDGFATIEPKTTFFIFGTKVNASVLGSFRERRAKGLSVYTAGLSEYETVHHITTYELRPKLEASILWKEIDNKLLVGADYFHAKDGILSGNRIGENQDETDIYKETIGLYIHDNIKISDIFLMNAGGRIEWSDYTFNQKRLIANRDTKKLREAAFNFGVGYKYNKKSQVYFDISRSFNFPTTEDYYQNKYLWGGIEYGGLNKDIKHQQGINYEIGIKDLTFDWLHVNADLFLMDVKNEIYYDPYTFNNANYKPKIRHYGLELETMLNLFEGRLKPFMNWTLQESFFKGGEFTGEQVPLVPKNKISAGITIYPVKQLDWTTNLNYTGSSFMINDQRNVYPKLKDYVTFDTKLGFKHKFFNIWGAVKNIFDIKYSGYGVIGSGGEAFYPSPERRFEAGMSLTF